MLAVKKAVYLTIDDGPAEDFLQKVNYLNSLDIKVVWFCLGEALERFSEEAIYAIKAGHIIGNRSYDHVDFSSIPVHAVKDQIERTDRIIDELYSKANAARPSKLFRFPFMEHIADDMSEDHFGDIQRVLEEQGYHQPFDEKVKDSDEQSFIRVKSGIHVSCTLDTFDLGLADVLDESSDKSAAYGNEIIMIHDWISLASFKTVMDKLAASDVAFRLPKEMNQHVAVV